MCQSDAASTKHEGLKRTRQWGNRYMFNSKKEINGGPCTIVFRDFRVGDNTVETPQLSKVISAIDEHDSCK